MANQQSRITTRLYEAMELTFKLHGQDARKSTNVPMLTHLFSVCSLVQHDGGDEDEAIAALLHDALEDKPEQITRIEIEEHFGRRVLAIIDTATDTPPDYNGGTKPPWRKRKEAYLAHARSADPELLSVTIADKIDNVRAILSDHKLLGDSLWQRFNAGKADQIWYYRSAAEAYETAGAQGPLLEELQRLVKDLCQLVDSTS
jgi:(p)ppGpp synthase/HD superfamily hydrolase